MQSYRSYLLFLAMLCLAGQALPAAEIYFVDAHSQVDHEVHDLGLILKRMDEHGVRKTILSARSGRTPDEIAAFARDSGDRIIPAIRTKSGAYSRNPSQHYKKLDAQHASGQFAAMAEVLLFHAQKGDKAEQVDILADDPRVQYALAIARQESWPFVIHIEFASLTGQRRTAHMKAMEEMLRENPGHPFVLDHMGQLNSDEVARLIERHPNLYFLTAHTNPYVIERSQEPWTNMFSGKVLAPQWKALVVKHPDRFVLALDNVWARHWQDYYAGQMDYWHSATADLPAPVAHALAHGNAERLWRIAPD